MKLRRRKSEDEDGPQTSGDPVTKIFFVTDVHGSELCFRKFLNAAAFYSVDYLILGGDITGKSLVPIEITPRGWTARYGDRTHRDMSREERAALEQDIRDHGQYPVIGEHDELLKLTSEEHREEVFRQAVVESMTRWMQLATERLSGKGIRCFVTPGNDDYWDIDPVLENADIVEFVEGRCVQLGDRHEMLTTGFSNPTPWQTPRELSEADLRGRLETIFADVRDPASLVAVIHPPPYDTRLDQAPTIDSEFRIQMEGPSPRMSPVGSTAVRDFIEEHQPLLALHGHVHESRGSEMIGRTLCINPGSEYSDGNLSGALVTLRGGVVASHQLVTG